MDYLAIILPYCSSGLEEAQHHRSSMTRASSMTMASSSQVPKLQLGNMKLLQMTAAAQQCSRAVWPL